MYATYSEPAYVFKKRGFLDRTSCTNLLKGFKCTLFQLLRRAQNVSTTTETFICINLFYFCFSTCTKKGDTDLEAAKPANAGSKVQKINELTPLTFWMFAFTHARTDTYARRVKPSRIPQVYVCHYKHRDCVRAGMYTAAQTHTSI